MFGLTSPGTGGGNGGLLDWLGVGDVLRTGVEYQIAREQRESDIAAARIAADAATAQAARVDALGAVGREEAARTNRALLLGGLGVIALAFLLRQTRQA